jgi:hypothetical protein
MGKIFLQSETSCPERILQGFAVNKFLNIVLAFNKRANTYWVLAPKVSRV